MSAMQVLVLPVPVAIARSISRRPSRSLSRSLDGVLLVMAQREAVLKRLSCKLLVSLSSSRFKKA